VRSTAVDLQLLIYSIMNKLIYQDDDGDWILGFPDDDDEESMILLENLVDEALDPDKTATIIIMLMNSLTYWYIEALMERDSETDPRLHLANLSHELFTKGFGKNVLGDQ